MLSTMKSLWDRKRPELLRGKDGITVPLFYSLGGGTYMPPDWYAYVWQPFPNIHHWITLQGEYRKSFNKNLWKGGRCLSFWLNSKKDVIRSNFVWGIWICEQCFRCYKNELRLATHYPEICLQGIICHILWCCWERFFWMLSIYI